MPYSVSMARTLTHRKVHAAIMGIYTIEQLDGIERASRGTELGIADPLG